MSCFPFSLDQKHSKLQEIRQEVEVRKSSIWRSFHSVEEAPTIPLPMQAFSPLFLCHCLLFQGKSLFMTLTWGFCSSAKTHHSPLWSEGSPKSLQSPMCSASLLLSLAELLLTLHNQKNNLSVNSLAFLVIEG